MYLCVYYTTTTTIIIIVETRSRSLRDPVSETQIIYSHTFFSYKSKKKMNEFFFYF